MYRLTQRKHLIKKCVECEDISHDDVICSICGTYLVCENVLPIEGLSTREGNIVDFFDLIDEDLSMLIHSSINENSSNRKLSANYLNN